MKPTPRRGGRQMATFNVMHVLGGYEIARLLVRYAGAHQPEVWDGDPEDPGRDLTRGQVEDLVRRWLYEAGTGAYLTEDDVDVELRPDQALRLVAWAAGQVRRLYPSMVDSELDKWVAGHTTWCEEWAAKRAAYAAGQND